MAELRTSRAQDNLGGGSVDAKILNELVERHAIC